MTALERQVFAARHRLWLNRGLRWLGWSMTIAAILFLVLVVVERLTAVGVPLNQAAIWLAGAAVLTTLIGTIASRDSIHRAAEALDSAAGLRERVSSSLYSREEMSDSDDAFQSAVRADAERSVAGIRASHLIPVRWNRSLTVSLVGVMLAAGIFYFFPEYDLLGRAEASQKAQRERERSEQVKKLLQPAIASMQADAEQKGDSEMADALKDVLNLEQMQAETMSAEKLRVEAMTKLNRIGDELKDKAESERFGDLEATKQMLAQMPSSSDPTSSVGQMIEALKDGDFELAQKKIDEMKEELAKRDHNNPEDRKKNEEMQKQLNDMAKQLEQIAKKQQEKVERDMQNKGVSKEDVKRVLDALAKKDKKQLEELKKELEKKLQDSGASQQQAQQQAQQMMEQMQQSQQACQNCESMSQSAKESAQAMENGQNQQAGEAMQQASEMLSDMENMSQELNELESQMSQLDQLKEQLGDSGSCDKPGEGEGEGGEDGNGPGQGQGDGKGDFAKGKGKGTGERERAKDGDLDFVKRKSKVRSNGGDIIGLQFVKGKQMRGDVKSSFNEIIITGEKDPTETIERGRIPRVYHDSLIKYFDRGVKVAPASEKKSKEASKEPVAADSGN